MGRAHERLAVTCELRTNVFREDEENVGAAGGHGGERGKGSDKADRNEAEGTNRFHRGGGVEVDPDHWTADRVH